MMKRSTLAILAALAMALGGCGTLIGAGAGGVIGHEVTDGSKAGTIGGAALGGIIGHELSH